MSKARKKKRARKHRKKLQAVKPATTQAVEVKHDTKPATLPVGTRVRRGPNWQWGDQDCRECDGSNLRNYGTVVAWDSNEPFSVHVRWDYGNVNAYRWGHVPELPWLDEGTKAGYYYDLEIVADDDPDDWQNQGHDDLIDELLGAAQTEGEAKAEPKCFKFGGS